MKILLELTAKRVVKYLARCEKITRDDEIACYQYGIEIIMSSLLSIVLVLLIGLISMHFIESVFFLAVFIFVRQFTGGYHADTYFRCNLCMCIFFVSVLMLYECLKNCNEIYVFILMNLVSLGVITAFSPVDNRHKPIKKEDRKPLKFKAVIISFAVSVISIIMHCFSIKYGVLIACTLLLISMLVIAGNLKERGIKNYESRES